MRATQRLRASASLLIIFCILASPITVLAKKKGEKNFKEGLKYETAQQWDRAVQEYALALAADPSNIEYQLHYRRSVFNASQYYMQQGRTLSEKQDYIGGYNAFRLAFGLDPVNELAQAEMERMVRLQREKEDERKADGNGAPIRQTSFTSDQQSRSRRNAEPQIPTRNYPERQLKYNGDLKALIRTLADQLDLNIIFDPQTFRTPRPVEIDWKSVTAGHALDLLFLQEGLFFQRVSRRTIIIADQQRRPQYQQLVMRTFYLANIDPQDARNLLTAAIPPSTGRPQTQVIADKATNSITVRDTLENVNLIGDIIKSIDKDRAEVVMDVNIYEVSRDDLLQFGNQLGTDTSFTNLGGVQGGYSILQGSVGRIATIVGSAVQTIPTSFGSALVFPSSSIAALQKKNNTRLVASTQVHAFTGEESQARIGQRVPVQTAQTFPFGSQTTTPNNPNVNPGIGFGGGFPVFQYEPTGLTLKFTPQVFPNLDVQVKMSIESKDVLVGGLTPTFTERTITGTARIQNNRTMLLASVATNKEANSRGGIALLGLIPILGRLFTAPRRERTQTDIVIAVTPRVLRAPTVSPADELARASGTLMSPTSGSIETILREADVEDAQIAADRTRAAESTARATEASGVVPAPRTMIEANNATNAEPAPASAPLVSPSGAQSGVAAAVSQLVSGGPVKQTVDSGTPLTPAPMSLVNRVSTPAEPKPATPVDEPVVKTEPPAAEIRFGLERGEMRVGERQRVALVVTSASQLGSAIIKFRFDSKSIAVRGVSQGEAGTPESLPTIMQMVDPSGIVMLSVSPKAGSAMKSGENVLLFIEIEAIGAGDCTLAIDRASVNLVSIDGTNVSLRLVDSKIVIKK